MQKESLPLNPNPSPNLLGNFGPNTRFDPKKILIIKILILLPIVLYIFLHSLNYVLADSNKKLLADTKKLAAITLTMKAVENDARLIILKTDLYKKYLGERKSLKKNLELFYNNLPQNIILEKMTFADTKIIASIKAPSAITVSLFFNELLQRERVDNINLQSFSYDGTLNSYQSDFEVNFK